jgi:diguanylate cyclase (GGDEF)-like protein/PAS domain S-box-containing protein
MSDNSDALRFHQEEPGSGNEDDAEAARLIRQVEHYVRLLHITHEAIICVDEHGRILVFNQGAEKLFGYRHDEIIGRHLNRLVCRRCLHEERRRLAALTRIARENRLGFQTDRIRGQRKNGERFPTEVSLSQTPLPGRHLYTLVVRDATQRLMQEQQLTYQAEHDELTDLPNRVLLNDRLNASIARAERYRRKLGVIFIDLDDFKPINDLYGHVAGDCLLQAVARRLQDAMRQSDTVSRTGGDEFIVCLEQIKNARDACAAATKIADAIRHPYQILGTHMRVSASVGIAIYPDHGQDAITLIRRADEAMYLSKAAGGTPRLFRALD